MRFGRDCLEVAGSQAVPDLPELGEESPRDGALEIRDAATTGARSGTDLARRHERMMKAPARDRLVVVEEQFAHAVENRAIRGRVVAVQRRQRLDATLAQLRAVANGRVEPLRAHRRAERGEERR